MRKALHICTLLFDNLQKIILVLSSVLLVITLSVTVVMRYILKTDIFGLEELIIIPGFWLYFLGAGYATREKDFHISADLVSSYVTNQTILKVVYIITSVFTLIISMVMTYWSFDFLSWSFTGGSRTPALKIPEYIAQGSVFTGFLIMTIYFLIHLINDIYSVITGRDHNESGELKT